MIVNKPPSLPKATAVWLLENTTLTFEQIADFCNLHQLEVEGIANKEVEPNLKGEDPIANLQLTMEEIKRCEKDSSTRLRMSPSLVDQYSTKVSKKVTKYIPRAKRRDKPNAIYWLIKNYPDITDREIIKLIGTTKNMIMAIREKNYWNMKNIKPIDPVILGLCSQQELNVLRDKYNSEDLENGAF